MNTDRIKWMGAIPYLMVLLIVVNGDIVGNYDVNILGMKLSLLTFLPFIIYYFVNRDHDNEFISVHVKNAMRYFLRYFVVTMLLSISVTIFGYGVLTFDPVAAFTSGLLGLIFVLPFIAAVILVIIFSVIGSIRAFKLILPDKRAWQYEEPPVLV